MSLSAFGCFVFKLSVILTHNNSVYNKPKSSAVADKPRDAFVQYAMAMWIPKTRPSPVCVIMPTSVVPGKTTWALMSKLECTGARPTLPRIGLCYLAEFSRSTSKVAGISRGTPKIGERWRPANF